MENKTNNIRLPDAFSSVRVVTKAGKISVELLNCSCVASGKRWREEDTACRAIGFGEDNRRLPDSVVPALQWFVRKVVLVVS